MPATSKVSDQTAHMRRLIWDFAGRTYHIVGNLMSRLTCIIKSYMDYILQVLMKDIVTPVPPEEVRHVIKKCLENAALVNYTRISEYAKIEGKFMLPK